MPNHPTVAANEWIAAKLASMLGLPVQDHVIAEMDGKLFFASRWMQTGTFHPALTEAVFQQCANRDRAYDVVVFDVWLINQDRHQENLIARRVSRGSSDHLLMLNDHSHLLVSPYGPATVGALMRQVDSSCRPYIRLGFLAASIRDPRRLGQSLATAEALKEDDIRSVVASTPPELLSASDQAIYADFLVQRQPKLRGMFRQDWPTVLPNLQVRHGQR